MAASVTFTLKDATGAAFASGLVTVKTKTAPHKGVSYIVGKTVAMKMTDGSGVVTFSLEAGEYWVSWMAGTQITTAQITVPSSIGEYRAEQICDNSSAEQKVFTELFLALEDGTGRYARVTAIGPDATPSDHLEIVDAGAGANWLDEARFILPGGKHFVWRARLYGGFPTLEEVIDVAPTVDDTAFNGAFFLLPSGRYMMAKGATDTIEYSLA